MRRGGSAALDMAWVAAGWLDGYWERGIHVWDLAAGVLLIREAGGVVTDYSGRPWQPADRNVVAANSVLHETLPARLANRARRACRRCDSRHS